jgi:hypothetical protein
MSPGGTLGDGSGMVDQRMRRHAVVALRRRGHEVAAVAAASSLAARGADARAGGEINRRRRRLAKELGRKKRLGNRSSLFMGDASGLRPVWFLGAYVHTSRVQAGLGSSCVRLQP